MILPEQNLMNRENNDLIYFSRMADELLRYKRIRLFMLYSDSYIYLSSSEYKIYSNEFIIAKSALNDTYFEELIPFSLENYARNTTYENTNPSVKPANPTQLWMDAYNQKKN